MISIIVEDKSITIDGVGAKALDDRVSTMVASDVRALQFHEEKGIGHLEFTYEYGDERRGNQHITESDINIPVIKALHATLIAEEESRREAERAAREAEEAARLEQETNDVV
tara:strand:+ start:656 stop:991 length:336 start_codon:yes stop_codon:yes gene_type:complete